MGTCCTTTTSTAEATANLNIPNMKTIHRASRSSSTSTPLDVPNNSNIPLIRSKLGINAWIDEFCLIYPSESQVPQAVTPRSRRSSLDSNTTQFARTSHNQKRRFSIRFDPAPITDSPLVGANNNDNINDNNTTSASRNNDEDVIEDSYCGYPYSCSSHHSLPAPFPMKSSSIGKQQCPHQNSLAHVENSSTHFRTGPCSNCHPHHQAVHWDLSPATLMLSASLSAKDNSKIIVVEEYDSGSSAGDGFDGVTGAPITRNDTTTTTTTTLHHTRRRDHCHDIHCPSRSSSSSALSLVNPLPLLADGGNIDDESTMRRLHAITEKWVDDVALAKYQED